jgi:glycerophosphoryl diester phosphodiesterase
MNILAIFAYYLHVIAPSDTATIFRKQVPIQISAHRGNTGWAPENSMATFQKALEIGVNFIEIDVRTSADGQLVILHDGNLDRTTNGHGPIKQLTFTEIRKLSAGKGYGPAFEKEKIPSLEEVCQLISRWNKKHPQKTFIYVDCKDVAPKPLVEMLKKYALAEESCFYGSDSFLENLKTEFPAAKLMPSLKNKGEIESKIERLQPYAFDTNWLAITPELVQEIHQRGIKVFSDVLGPFDQSSTYQKALKLGIDLIQTDKPRLVQKTLLQAIPVN